MHAKWKHSSEKPVVFKKIFTEAVSFNMGWIPNYTQQNSIWDWATMVIAVFEHCEWKWGFPQICTFYTQNFNSIWTEKMTALSYTKAQNQLYYYLRWNVLVSYFHIGLHLINPGLQNSNPCINPVYLLVRHMLHLGFLAILPWTWFPSNADCSNKRDEDKQRASSWGWGGWGGCNKSSHRTPEWSVQKS